MVDGASLIQESHSLLCAGIVGAFTMFWGYGLRVSVEPATAPDALFSWSWKVP